MRYLIPIIVLLIFASASADETKTPPIILPMTPVLVEPDTPVPKPQPEFQPQVINSIKLGTLYVIESQIELFIKQVPNGVVEIEVSQSDGQDLKVNGVFADGTGKREWRVYKSKFVYILSSDKPGKTELVLVPSGVTAEKDILNQPIVVTGEGPRPPPVPDVDPVDPTPDVDPPGPPTGLRVLMVYNEDADRQQLDVVNSTEIVKWMTANCAKDPDGRAAWRRWDRTSIERTGVAGETEVWQKLWDKVKPLITQNNMVFVVTDTKVQFMPMTNVADTLAFLQRVKDGK